MRSRKNLDVTILKTMYSEGKSQKEIAGFFHVNQVTVYRYMKEYGIQSRTLSEAQKERNRIPEKRNQGSQPGEVHPNYKHGAYSQERVYRKMIQKERCAECGVKKQLVIHHKNGDHYDNRLENLEVLCSPCHSRKHKTEYWEKKRTEKNNDS